MKLWGISRNEDGIHLWYDVEAFEEHIKSRKFDWAEWVCSRQIHTHLPKDSNAVDS